MEHIQSASRMVRTMQLNKLLLGSKMSSNSIKYLQEKVASRYLFLFLIALLSAGTSYGQSNCQAGFTYDMTYCPNIYFHDNSSADSNIVCWMFDYNGAGNIDMCAHAHNKFDTNGVYVVCISIMTIDGCTSSFCDTITIDCICERPEAGFSISQTGNACNFTDTSFLADIANTTWFWDFGDGTSSTLQDPSHVYTANGAYMACLTVTDTCASVMSCTPVAVNSVTTGLPEFDENRVNVYPIPANDWLRIDAMNSSSSLVEIFSVDGKLMLSEITAAIGDVYTLNVQSLQNGHYYLRIGNDREALRFTTIIIQH
jgi:hypothetical protein